MITLYHGSYTSVPSPLTGVGRRELDFGPGFYVTNLREQAERWARRVCVIRAADTPLLSIYEFDESKRIDAEAIFNDYFLACRDLQESQENDDEPVLDGQGN